MLFARRFVMTSHCPQPRRSKPFSDFKKSLDPAAPGPKSERLRGVIIYVEFGRLQDPKDDDVTTLLYRPQLEQALERYGAAPTTRRAIFVSSEIQAIGLARTIFGDFLSRTSGASFSGLRI